MKGKEKTGKRKKIYAEKLTKLDIELQLIYGS